MFTAIQERQIGAYVVLVMAGKATLDPNDDSGKKVAPEALREEIGIRIAEKELSVLEA